MAGRIADSLPTRDVTNMYYDVNTERRMFLKISTEKILMYKGKSF